jgi:uncharacterized repeat protein (TIGR03803 family)
MTRQSKLSILCILALATTVSAQWKEQLLYSFQGYPDGAIPVGSIVYDKQGNLYGATLSGGLRSCSAPGGGCGTVYELSPPVKKGDPWTETQVHLFQGRAFGDGSDPAGGLIMDAAGNLYGTTEYDGSGNCNLLGGVVGCGTVYELSPPAQPGGAWTETVLYNFQGGNDGYIPTGDLVFDKVGNLYGVTLFGGGRGTNCGDSLYPNCGTVFELSPPQTKGGGWTEKVLYSFSGLEPESIAGDGSEPNGGLVLDEAGNIYGTASRGGSMIPSCGGQGELSGCGATFELVPPKQNGSAWTENVLYRFEGALNDGAGPNGNLILAEGTLYGTTLSGGSGEFGIVYSLKPSKAKNQWVKTTLYSFGGGNNPGFPKGGLTVTRSGDVLGTASGGGATFAGAIFELMPPKPGGEWGLLDLYDFGQPPAAAHPIGELVSDGSNNFYGITQSGGTGQACDGGCGTVYEASP